MIENYCVDCINKKGCINCENGELKETKQAPKTKLTEEERKAFEAALESAWQKYRDGARLVDRFEDNYIECAFSKGFLQGYIAKQISIKDIIRAISTSNKILAIKIVAKCLDMNLKDSKEYVEALQQTNN